MPTTDQDPTKCSESTAVRPGLDVPSLSLKASSMTTDVTRLEVRRTAIAFVVATLATSVAVVLGAGGVQILAVAAVAFGGTMIGIQMLVASGAANIPGQQARWMIVLFVGAWIGIWLGQAWFPKQDITCEPPTSSETIGDQVVTYCHELVFVDRPANVARSLVFAGASGLAAWLVALMLPLDRSRRLARLEYWGSGDPPHEIAPGERPDLILALLAVVSVVASPMGAMDELTAPFGWPWVQIAAAFLMSLPLIKRRSLAGALIVYRITFLVYAVLLARLMTGTAPTLTLPERAVIGLALAGVLAMSVVGHVRTARLRDVGPTGGLQSGVVA